MEPKRENLNRNFQPCLKNHWSNFKSHIQNFNSCWLKKPQATGKG